MVWAWLLWIGVSWVYVSIHDYGNTPVYIAVIFTSLFIAFLALFPAVQGYCLIGLFKEDRFSRELKALFYFPLSWVFFEWIRSWILTGFPWLQLGHSQANSYLAGFIPIVGVFGVTAIVVFLSGLFYLVCQKNHGKKK